MKRVFLAFALCFYAICINAQHDSGKKDTAIILSGAEVSATRADLTTPVSQKNMSKEDIRNGYFGQDMPVILGNTPSFTYYSDGGAYTGYMYMRLRGIDQTRLNMTLNGVPLNEPEDEGCYFSNFTDFANNINSMQIQRGVGTSSNGVASYGGSINFESISPLDSAGTELQTGIGSFNSKKLSASCNTGLLDNKTAFYARYSSTMSDGYRYHSGTNASTFFMSGGYFGEKNIFRITAFVGNSKNQMAYLAAPESEIATDPRTNDLSPSERDDFTQKFVQLQHTRKINLHSYISTSLYYVRLDGAYGVLYSDTMNGAPIMHNFGISSDFYGFFSNYNWSNKNTKVKIGIHANDYQRTHSMGESPVPTDLLYSNSGTKQEVSGFIKVSHDIGKLTLFGDLQERAVYFQYHPYGQYGISVAPINWTFFNPKAGVTYSFNNKMNAYCSVGQTHREPTRNAMFAGADDINPSNVSQLGNLATVKPESVIDYELGTNIKYKNLYVQADVYDMEFTNEITPIGQLSYIGLPLTINVPSSYRRGIELDFNWHIAKGISAFGNLNYGHNIIKQYTDSSTSSITYKNVNYLLTPSVNNNMGIKYSYKKLFSVQAGSSYWSKMYLTNTNDESHISTSMLVFNAGLTVNFMKNNSITFLCNNLLNLKYYNSGYVQGGENYYYIAASRNFFVTLNMKF